MIALTTNCTKVVFVVMFPFLGFQLTIRAMGLVIGVVGLLPPPPGVIIFGGGVPGSLLSLDLASSTCPVFPNKDCQSIQLCGVDQFSEHVGFAQYG